MNKLGHQFFSISFDYVVRDKEMAYDLYINSSAITDREKYIKIYPKGDILSKEDISLFKKKYHQLYVHESQRNNYLKSLIDLSGTADIEKTEVIRDSAIHYLDKLFSNDKEFTTEILEETINDCKLAVESMVEVIKDYDVCIF